MYLFFDTETTGVPKDYRAPLTDFNNWPRLVQLAYLVYGNDGELAAKGDFIIKPVGFEIPVEASNIHGISNEKALEEGNDLLTVLKIFQQLVIGANVIVGHNISFDRKIVGAEFLRCELEDSLHGTNRVCTMFTTTKFCAIPNVGRAGFKWPKLQELHNKLFNEDFDGAHNAFADIEATAKCFWELKRLNVIDDAAKI